MTIATRLRFQSIEWSKGMPASATFELPDAPMLPQGDVEGIDRGMINLAKGIRSVQRRMLAISNPMALVQRSVGLKPYAARSNGFKGIGIIASPKGSWLRLPRPLRSKISAKSRSTQAGKVEIGTSSSTDGRFSSLKCSFPTRRTPWANAWLKWTPGSPARSVRCATRAETGLNPGLSVRCAAIKSTRPERSQGHS